VRVAAQPPLARAQTAQQALCVVDRRVEVPHVHVGEGELHVEGAQRVLGAERLKPPPCLLRRLKCLLVASRCREGELQREVGAGMCPVVAKPRGHGDRLAGLVDRLGNADGGAEERPVGQRACPLLRWLAEPVERLVLPAHALADRTGHDPVREERGR